jgi:transcriptional regulator with XRE-family HTH domain
MRSNRRQREQFGRFLDVTLDNLGISSRTVAQRLGMDDSAVSRYRNGVSLPSASVLADLARILDLDPLRLTVTAGHVPADVAGVDPYPMPTPTAQRESVRRQIERIKGLSDTDRGKLLDTYDELISKMNTEGEP